MEEENNIQDWDDFIKEIKIVFSNKNKVADTEWKIETLRQEKKYVVNFIIKFKALVMKAETNNMHAIFLLKKNVRSNIIKKVLGYLSIVVSETFKEWKVAIPLVEQEYKFIEGRQDYRIGSGITYRGRGAPMDIEKSNYNKDRKLMCFNCNVYGHMTKDCWKPKKKRRLGSATSVIK